MRPRLVAHHGDIVVRQDTRDGSRVYELSAAPGPDQYLVRERDDAVAQAVAFAKRAHVRAWFANGEAVLVPLGQD